MPPLPGFIGPSYPSQSVTADAERTVNWYLERIEAPGGASQAAAFSASQMALYPTPGQTAWLTTVDIGTRALFAMNGRAHAVLGTGVYELFSTMTGIRRGTVTQDEQLAQITTNGPTGILCVCSGKTVYYLTLSNNVLSTVAGVAAQQVGMIDGYFIAFDPVAAKIRLSPLNDTTGVWDPTQFAQRSIAPDPWKAMVTADRIGSREVWLIGEQTGEVWYDAGTFPFPLAPIPGAIFKYGTPAPFSVAAVGAQVVWLSQTAEGAGIVVAARGYQPLPVSNNAVHTAMARYQRTSTIADAEGFSYQQEGHSFYVLKFPSANATWVYDPALPTPIAWHERGTWNSALSRYDAWHPRVHAYAFGQHLVGESGTGTISSLDVTVGTEADGSPIRRLRRAPALVSEGRQIAYRRLQLWLEAGLGTSTGQGANPLILLRCSDDGGKTFSNERSASAGKIGQYKKRPFWTRLGVSRDRLFEVTVSDPIPWRLVDAWVNNDGGASGGQ